MGCTGRVGEEKEKGQKSSVYFEDTVQAGLVGNHSVALSFLILDKSRYREYHRGMIDNILPGYLTLSEAEEKYGIKADTLKKRCQKGEVIGAKKVGKTWFVPVVPGIDPQKTYPENYLDLDFEAALISNSSLYDAEEQTKSELYDIHSHSVYIWEYGFYFLSLIFGHTRLEKTYMPLVAIVTEAHSALRGAFLLNLNGYHGDAMALLRKSHECTTKAVAMKANNQKFWQIAFSKSREVSEHKIGIDLKSLYALESSFGHSNLMKVFGVGKEVQDGKEKISVGFGPQVDHKLFRVAMNTSIFWLYALTLSLPYLFPGQITETWLKRREASAKLLKDYLEVNKAFSKETKSFEEALVKLGKTQT